MSYKDFTIPLPEGLPSDQQQDFISLKDMFMKDFGPIEELCRKIESDFDRASKTGGDQLVVKTVVVQLYNAYCIGYSAAQGCQAIILRSKHGHKN